MLKVFCIKNGRYLLLLGEMMPNKSTNSKELLPKISFLVKNL